MRRLLVAVAVVALALVNGTLCGNSLRRDEPEDGARLVASGFDHYGPPKFSPDGKLILFAGFQRESGETSLWLLSVKDGSLRKVNATEGAHDPSWSPDGKRIAFVSTEKNGLCVANVKDKSVKVLCREVGDSDYPGFDAPCWSPDGKRIAFGRENHISVIDADGKNPVQVTPDRMNRSVYELTWTSSGRIVFSWMRQDKYSNFLSSSIYAVNPDGTGLKRLTNGLQEDSEIAVSPDGRRVAFSRKRDKPTSSSIYIVNIDGTSLKRLTRGPDLSSEPSWSPSGRRIAFVKTQLGKDSTVTIRKNLLSSSVFTMNADGTGATRLTRSIVGYWKQESTPPRPKPTRLILDCASPCWSPDGKKLAFLRFLTVPSGGSMGDESNFNDRRAGIAIWSR